MSLEQSLEQLKTMIFDQNQILDERRLICTIIEQYKKEFKGTQELAAKYSALEKEHSALKEKHAALKDAHLKLEASQATKSPQFELHKGILWKKTETGFEPFPYCNECQHHPVMHRPTPMARVWVCSQGHTAPFTYHPDLHR